MMKYQSKAHQIATEQKMKLVAEMQQYPLSLEEMDKVLEEHFETHGKANPNKKKN